MPYYYSYTLYTYNADITSPYAALVDMTANVKYYVGTYTLINLTILTFFFLWSYYNILYIKLYFKRVL